MVLTRAISKTTRYKAERLLRAVARAKPIGVMSVAPTYTQGGAGVNSTINASATATGASSASQKPTYVGSDARLEWVSAHVSLDAWNGFGWIPDHKTKAASGNYRYLGSDGWGVRFATDAQAFDFNAALNTSATGSGGTGACRVLVTDLATGLTEWTRAADYTGDASWRYYKFDFGSRAPRGRLITIYFTGNAFFVGLNVGAQDRVWKEPSPDEAKIAYFGDSYGEGVGVTSSIRGALPYVFGELMGAPNVISSSSAGTGYANAGSNVTWAARVARDMDYNLIGDMDLVTVFGTANDNAQSDGAVTAAITSTITDLMVAQPNAIIVVAGPQYAVGIQTTLARYALVKAAVQAVPGYGGRLFYVDNGPADQNWMSGLGKQGATTGTGNGDFYVASDGVHPYDAAGSSYLATRLKGAVVPILQGLAA